MPYKLWRVISVVPVALERSRSAGVLSQKEVLFLHRAHLLLERNDFLLSFLHRLLALSMLGLQLTDLDLEFLFLCFHLLYSEDHLFFLYLLLLLNPFFLLVLDLPCFFSSFLQFLVFVLKWSKLLLHFCEALICSSFPSCQGHDGNCMISLHCFRVFFMLFDLSIYSGFMLLFLLFKLCLKLLYLTSRCFFFSLRSFSFSIMLFELSSN